MEIDRLLRCSLAGSLAAFMALLLTPSSAEACGGVFCDAVDPPMSVDQSGEDILFVLDEGEVEAHIRIEYEGEAENFAWVIPLQAVPTDIRVGSEAFFARLSLATAARNRMTRDYVCTEDDPGDGSGGGMLDVGEGEGGGDGPEIVYSDTVGAFQVDVLQGGTAAEVIDWLDTNGYAQDPDAEPILAEYLDDGFLFAAVKLSAGADVDEIHPIAFRFPGTEPCVPLRLTRIAAKEDMGVRTYFLGNERAIPLNYDHVVRNPLRMTWGLSGFVPLSDEVVAMAVDEAGGHAFATDYAGTSSIVSTDSVYDSAWDSTVFVDAPPETVLATLEDMQLFYCFGECKATHALIRPLLMEYLPPPEGISADEFWLNIVSMTDQIDLVAWDAVAFATDFEERIAGPGLHAVDLLESWPYLTRLVTTLSPHEMTLDPTFATNGDLPDVSPRYEALQTSYCSNDVTVLYPDGQQVCVPRWNEMPTWEELPWATRIERMPLTGPPQVLVDNSAGVNTAVAGWNSTHTCDLSTSGDGDGDGDGDADSEGGMMSNQGLDGRGCACAEGSTGGRGGGVLAVMLFGGALGWRRRRH